MNDYRDIINLSRPVSKRPRMSLEQRSAQFASFAALKGYEDQVKETARLTNKRIEIDEEVKLELDLKIQLIQAKINEQPEIEITYFMPDNNKDGGIYKTLTNKIKKIDTYKNIIIMIDKTAISIDEIIDIQSKIFNDFPCTT